MKKQLLLVAFFLTSLINVAQTTTIDAAPTTLAQAETFTITASFDAGAGDTIDGNLAFVLRLYNTTDNTFTFVRNATVDKNGVNAESGVVSPNITVPADAVPTTNLGANLEYRLVVSYKRTVAKDFPIAAQVVTITEAVVPTITYSQLPTEMTTDGVGNNPFEISWSNATPGAKCFNQLRDHEGKQLKGFSFDITTASGTQVINWGNFDAGQGGVLVVGQFGYATSQYSGAAGITSANINVVATLSTDDFSLVNVSVFPNPTTDKITIETKQDFNSVNIFDVTGKSVRTFKSKKTLNVSDLTKGIYFLKTDTGLLGKFIKN